MAGAAQELTLTGLAAWAEASTGKLTRGFSRPLKAAGVMAQADAKRNFDEGHGPDGQAWPGLLFGRPSGRGSDQPLRDKGLLMASVTGRGKGHVESLTETSIEQGTNLEYAAIHQYGGTITARNGKMLSIPLTSAAARTTGPRGGGNPFPRPLFLIKHEGKNPVLAETVEKGRGKKKKPVVVAHFLLVPSVTIPARPFLGIGPQLAQDIAQLFSDWVGEQL